MQMNEYIVISMDARLRTALRIIKKNVMLFYCFFSSFGVVAQNMLLGFFS